MRIDRDGEPDYYYIKENITKELEKNKNNTVLVTQGYICKDFEGKTDNLRRGGSDKTATILGSVLNVNEVQIWSDKDGMLNNDPRFVEKTYPLEKLSYEEAEELACFGAKILHPSCIRPAKKADVKVVLKNTLNPNAKGTLISSESNGDNIKAVAAIDNITVIKVKSSEMLMAHGFVKKVFEIFDFYKTPVDMITTSEITVSVTIENDTFIEEIIGDLCKFANVETFENQAIVSVVGNLPPTVSGLLYKVFESLKEVPIRMISYGASNKSVSVVINSSEKVKALNFLNEKLFNEYKCINNKDEDSPSRDSLVLV